MEGMPERGPEIRSETLELIRNPEQVFDSSLEKARQEADKVERDLLRIENLHKASGGAEIHIETSVAETERAIQQSSIKIVWASPYEKSGTMLEFIPVSVGKGMEGGLLGYKGFYGYAQRKKDTFQFESNNIISLENLYKTPENTKLLVHPTVSRWAVGKDLITPEGMTDLYIGLGMLLKAEEWMYIGFHEAGHLPSEQDENQAWRKGKVNHASYYRGKKDAISSIAHGKSHGLFGVLKKPSPWVNALTVGRIERLGITSHATIGNAYLPDQWAQKSEESLDDLRRTILNAQFAYDNFFKR